MAEVSEPTKADLRNARRRERYASDYKYRERQLKAVAEWKKANPEKHKAMERKSHLKRTKGVSPEEVEHLLQSQGGICAVCRTDQPGGAHKQWQVDHCHSTQKVRGILCFNCNTSIGKLGDTIEGLERALNYLKRSQ